MKKQSLWNILLNVMISENITSGMMMSWLLRYLGYLEDY